MKASTLFVACITCLFLIGCGQPRDAKIKKVNLYLQNEPNSLDPRKGGDKRALQVLRDLFEGLTRIARDGSIELALAQSIDVSDDNLIYTFKLHPSQWSNGERVTAHDFEYAWKQAVNPEFPTMFAYAYYIIKNAKKAQEGKCSLDDVGVKALDDETLELTLEHLTPYLLEYIASPLFAPVCRSVDLADPDWSGKTYPEFVSNGPFVLKEHMISSQITLEKNPLYWSADKPKSDQLSFAIIEDPQTAYNMFLAGSLDWFGDPFGNMPFEICRNIQNQKKLDKKPITGCSWIFTNTTSPHLASPKIRTAIASAIDREDLTQNLMSGGEQPLYSLLPKSLSLLDKPFLDKDSPKKARELFEQSIQELGYTRETYPTLVLSHCSEPVNSLTAEAIQQQLQTNLGIRVELDAADWNSHLTKISNGEFQLSTCGWFAWFHDSIEFLEVLKNKESKMNGTGWEREEYIRLLDISDGCEDPKERNIYLKEAEAFIMQEMPLIPLINFTCKYSKNPNLNGEAMSQAGNLELKWVEKNI